jgi:hypothetical protein
MIKKKFNNFFFLSLIIILIAEITLNFFSTNIYGYNKLIFNIYIYLSFLIVISTFSIEKLKILSFEFKLIIFILFCFSIFQLLRIDDVNANLFADNLLLAKFGNISYGPMFLIPIFILWGLHKNAIYYFEKISLISIKIGTFCLPICFIFDLKYPIVAFLPSFFLLSFFQYSSPNKKVWILLGIFLSFIIFYLDNYRSGILRLTLGLFLFFIVFYKFKFLSRLFLIFSFIFPIIVFQNSTFSEKTFFEEASNMFSDSKIKNLSMDTRSFLYKETFSDLNYNKKLFFGKGPLGSYYSPMFDNLGSQRFYSGEDHYIRSTVEVGLLQYLLKGGVLYFVIISFIFLLTSFQSSKNDFINYLLLTIACYYLLFTIENLPFYDYLNALIWIIIGISISPNNKNLLNEDINKILTNNN